MAQQFVIVDPPNSQQGDPIRTAFVKVNENTQELYQNVSGNTAGISNLTTALNNEITARALLTALTEAPVYQDDAAADSDPNLFSGYLYRTTNGGRNVYMKPDPPTITGSLTVGSVLTAAGATTAQWKRNGTNIVGATSLTYTSTVADVGKALTVASGSLVSNPVYISIQGLITSLDSLAGVIANGGIVSRWTTISGSSGLMAATGGVSPAYDGTAVITTAASQHRMAEQVVKKSTIALPDALGGSMGNGFTCTGMVYDAVRNSYWISNDGRGEPLSIDFHPSIVEINDLGEKLSEIDVKNLCPNALSIQGICIDNSNTLWIASVSENKLHNFTKSGNFIKSWTVDASPNGLAFDATNNLLIVVYDVSGVCKTYNVSTGAYVSTLPTSPAVDQLQWMADGSLIGTLGLNGTDGTVTQLALNASTWRSRLNLYEANSVEGIAVKDGILAIANDSYFHQVNPPLNRILNYGLPALTPVQTVDLVVCFKRDVRPTNTTPLVLLGDPSTNPGIAIYSTNSTNDNQIQITCNTGIGTTNQQNVSVIAGLLTQKNILRVRIDLSTKTGSVWFNGTLISSSLAFPNCGSSVLLGQLAIGGAPPPLGRWISASYYDIWVAGDCPASQMGLVQDYLKQKHGL